MELFFKRLGIALGTAALLAFGVVFADPQTYTSLGALASIAALAGVAVAAGIAKLVEAIKRQNP